MLNRIKNNNKDIIFIINVKVNYIISSSHRHRRPHHRRPPPPPPSPSLFCNLNCYFISKYGLSLILVEQYSVGDLL